MLDLREESGAVLLPLKVSAGAATERLVGIHDGRLKVAVRTAPEKGKANKAVLALLARRLDLPKREMEIVAGETSPRKTVRVRTVTRETLQARIDRALSKEGSS